MYLFGHCDPHAESSVRQSAFRGLGVVVTFESNIADATFLLDCSDKICNALEERDIRGGLAVNVTWALSNLCDTLLVLYTQVNLFHT